MKRQMTKKSTTFRTNKKQKALNFSQATQKWMKANSPDCLKVLIAWCREFDALSLSFRGGWYWWGIWREPFFFNFCVLGGIMGSWAGWLSGIVSHTMTQPPDRFPIQVKRLLLIRKYPSSSSLSSKKRMPWFLKSTSPLRPGRIPWSRHHRRPLQQCCYYVSQ